MVEDSSAVATPIAPDVGERIGRADLRTVEASGLSLAGLAPTMAMALGPRSRPRKRAVRCHCRTCSP